MPVNVPTPRRHDLLERMLRRLEFQGRQTPLSCWNKIIMSVINHCILTSHYDTHRRCRQAMIGGCNQQLANDFHPKKGISANLARQRRQFATVRFGSNNGQFRFRSRRQN